MSEDTYSYQRSLSALERAGFERQAVEAMSMPEASLEYCCAQLPGGSPLRGLHVGNFLGVSLCYFAAYVRSLHTDSRIISIDANLTQGGIVNPAEAVARLLRAFALERHNLLLIGYSMEAPVEGKAFRYDPARPLARIPAEQRLEQQLEGLRLLGVNSLDFAVLDGSHDRDYVERELAETAKLLKPGGLVFLDDASEAWPQLRRLFEEAAVHGYEVLGTDGRVGVLRTRVGR